MLIEKFARIARHCVALLPFAICPGCAGTRSNVTSVEAVVDFDDEIVADVSIGDAWYGFGIVTKHGKTHMPRPGNHVADVSIEWEYPVTDVRGKTNTDYISAERLRGIEKQGNVSLVFHFGRDHVWRLHVLNKDDSPVMPPIEAETRSTNRGGREVIVWESTVPSTYRNLKGWCESFQRVECIGRTARKMKGLVAMMRKLCRSLWYASRHELEFDYCEVFPGKPLPKRKPRCRNVSFAAAESQTPVRLDEHHAT